MDGFGRSRARESQAPDLHAGGDDRILLLGQGAVAGIVPRNPYMTAARFVMAGRGPGRNVKPTASQIAGLAEPSP